MTAAEELRRAAALIRERAEAATPGPWHVSILKHEVVATLDDAEWDVADANVIVPWGGERSMDAEHIASWHPATALAVAELLDRVASDDALLTGQVRYVALTAARTYLGTTR